MKLFKKWFQKPGEENVPKQETDSMKKNIEVANELLPKIQETLKRINEEQGKSFICKGFENNGEYSFKIQEEDDEAGVVVLQLDVNVDNTGQELHSHYLYRSDMYFSVNNIASFLYQGIEERLVEGK